MSQNPDDSSTATVGVRSLAVLGTGSDVGKSTIAAGLCRLLANHGVRVAPFKGQNMSNNSQPALRPDGTYGEIGTAQAIQAEASRIPPRVEMNPVLLKSGGRRDSDGAYLCSVLVLGQTLAVEDYGALGQRTEELRSLVLDAHQRLADVTNAQVIILEGAGSCTELNLMERDIVNLPMVRKLKPACPWLLVANIDPGGVFAQVVGTKACLSPEDWDQCCGVVINRLRGEAKYFEPGPSILEKMVGKPIYVVPFVYDMNLPEEDGLGVERRLVNELSETTDTTSQQKPVVVIIAYPHISITSDFTPLENDDAYEVVWRRNGPPPRPYPETAAVILPGSRLTRLDLEWLRSRPDWIAFLHTHVERGGVLLGLCGGYQMLGMNVSDPDGIEGDSGTSVGLGFLPVETVIAPVVSKIVAPRVGYLRLPTPTEDQDNQPPTSKNDGCSIVADSDGRVSVQGFELRCGRTVKISHDSADNDNFGKFDADVAPLLQLTIREPRDHDTDHDGSDAEEENEGIRKGNIYGTYLHGILASRRARHALLSGIHRYHLAEDVEVDNGQDPLDKFANHLESCGLDYDTVWSMIHGTNE